MKDAFFYVHGFNILKSTELFSSMEWQNIRALCLKMALGADDLIILRLQIVNIGQIHENDVLRFLQTLTVHVPDHI